MLKYLRMIHRPESAMPMHPASHLISSQIPVKYHVISLSHGLTSDQHLLITTVSYIVVYRRLYYIRYRDGTNILYDYSSK